MGMEGFGRKIIAGVAAIAALNSTDAKAQSKHSIPAPREYHKKNAPIITNDSTAIKAYADSEYAYERGEKFYDEGKEIYDKDTAAFNEFEKKESPIHDPRIKDLKP